MSNMGRPGVHDELRKMKLSLREQYAVDKTLKRVAVGEHVRGDIGYLGRDVWEVRVRLDRRILRLLYFIELDPRLNVVVLAAIKKTQQTPPMWIALALERKAQWDSVDFESFDA